MEGLQKTFADYGGQEMSNQLSTISGVVNFVSWYDDTPVLEFAQPGVAISDRPGLPLTELVGSDFLVEISEERYCTECGKQSEKSTCDDCTGKPPMAPCVWDPAKNCNYNDCPFPEYKQRSCSHTHVVYLALSNQVKIGMGRESRIRVRWAEQGATHAIPICRAPNRKVAGLIEDVYSETWNDQSCSSWYVPIEDPVASLTSAVLDTVGQLDEPLSQFHLWGDSSNKSPGDRVVPLPEISSPDIDDQQLSNHSLMRKGTARQGQLCAIRGNLLAFDDFVLNLDACKGHTITIKTDDPFLEDADLHVPANSDSEVSSKPSNTDIHQEETA